jgi:hypothetical protein
VTESAHPAPNHLGDAGRALWDRMTAGLEYDDPAELEVVRKAAELEDTAAALAEALEAESLMVEGSRGQRVVNGLVAELRLTRDTIGRLLGKIRVVADEAPSAGRKMTRSESGRVAASARWGKAS